MFIHLGGDIVIRSTEVVAILNNDMRDASAITKGFLLTHEKEDNVICISDELIKSIVVTEKKIYYSPISSLTLKKRSHIISELESFVDAE